MTRLLCLFYLACFLPYFLLLRLAHPALYLHLFEQKSEELSLAIEEQASGLLEELSRRISKKFTPFYSIVLNVPFCLRGQHWLEETSIGDSFDLLKYRKRACKVTVRIPQCKVTKCKLIIAHSFSIFSEKFGTKTFIFLGNSQPSELSLKSFLFSSPNLHKLECWIYFSSQQTAPKESR